MALELAIFGMLTGIALGLRYKVFVLVLAVTLTMIFAIAGGIAHHDSLGSIILAMAVVGTAIQIGYLTGVVIRAVAGPIFASMIGGPIRSSTLKLGVRA